MRPVLPHEVPLVINKIPGWEKYLTMIYDKIESGEAKREEGDGFNIGYYILDNDEMEKFFKPIFDELKIKPKVTYAYTHYAMKRGNFSVHTHDLPHAVYYIQAPEGAGVLHFPDHDFVNVPRPFQFFVVPRNTRHGIDTHNSDVYRVAITIQMEMPEY